MSLENSPAGRACFTIPEFCQTYRLSRSTLYKLWAAGTGPRAFKVGSKNLISAEAAANWLREREAAASVAEAA